MKSTLPLITQDYSSLIGIPYTSKDCWGIVVSFYQLCFGIELKRYYDNPPNDIHKAKNLIYSNIGDFTQIGLDEIVFGDIMNAVSRLVDGSGAFLEVFECEIQYCQVVGKLKFFILWHGALGKDQII